MTSTAAVTMSQHFWSDRYHTVRAVLPALAAGFSPEDLAAQSMPECSPGKWHLAHTSWFFEAMILSEEPGYVPVDTHFQTLFNSYYDALGERVARHERGLMTRPSLEAVLAYRQEIDRRMTDWLERTALTDQQAYVVELGMNHEQQHQELFLMDMLNLMSRSPLDPAAYAEEPRHSVLEAAKGGTVWFDGGLALIGHEGKGFAFDNESPAHRQWLEPFGLAADLVSQGDWLNFIADGGYRRPELWLSDGWARVQAEAWEAPLYWREEADGWSMMTLAGRKPVAPEAAVRHISFYEADAFARWSGKRLPTEAEWEQAMRCRPEAFSGAFGEVWQWTASGYDAYPGFAPTPGTAAEYNGKFMANQKVLRGASFATPEGHERVSYRNFFYPHQRWAFAGLRLAEDRAAPPTSPGQDGDAARFRRDLVAGLSKTPKATSPKWFYDARGSDLFEHITDLAEYYPTRQEAALLRGVAPQWAERFGPDATLVEFGSGASEKTRIVLDAAPDLHAYVPIDISAAALEAAAARISTAYPGLTVAPLVGDFLHMPPLPDGVGAGRRIGFFPGSTIGNLEPDEAEAFLRAARSLLGTGSLFILGVDMVKDPAVLVAAYDDAQGVTAAFNLNLLARANRELRSDFDVDAFAHQARWNAAENRMEMHLQATRPMQVRIGETVIAFERGETIHTESSRKFTKAAVQELAQAAGWTELAFEVGPEPSVALALLGAD
jgi:dimethylhistidine N-methyltransferase